MTRVIIIPIVLVAVAGCSDTVLGPTEPAGQPRFVNRLDFVPIPTCLSEIESAAAALGAPGPGPGATAANGRSKRVGPRDATSCGRRRAPVANVP
jgi:hypothetical protein